MGIMPRPFVCSMKRVPSIPKTSPHAAGRLALVSRYTITLGLSLMLTGFCSTDRVTG